ncbi:TPT1 [Sanghuangporus sanghuang]
MERIEERKQQQREQRQAAEKPSRQAYKKGPRLRGNPRDEEDVRISKTLSWVLRHGAKTEGLIVRPDGYARVRDLLALQRFRDVNFQTLERIVQHDAKERYHLLFEPGSSENSAPDDCWWIRANQGHTMKDIDLDFAEITDAGQVPMAVHGTNFQAWQKIKQEGLSPMKRTHIHLAQHISHIKGMKATPGLRNKSQVLIYVDLDKAIRAGIHFYLSANGVVLTKGDETGFLRPEYFQRVTDALGSPLPGWSGVFAEEKRKSRSRSRERQAKERRKSMEKVSSASKDAELETTVIPTTKALSDLNLNETQ